MPRQGVELSQMRMRTEDAGGRRSADSTFEEDTCTCKLRYSTLVLVNTFFVFALCGWLGYTTYTEWTSGLTLASVDEEVQALTSNITAVQTQLDLLLAGDSPSPATPSSSTNELSIISGVVSFEATVNNSDAGRRLRRLMTYTTPECPSACASAPLYSTGGSSKQDCSNLDGVVQEVFDSAVATGCEVLQHNGMDVWDVRVYFERILPLATSQDEADQIKRDMEAKSSNEVATTYAIQHLLAMPSFANTAIEAAPKFELEVVLASTSDPTTAPSSTSYSSTAPTAAPTMPMTPSSIYTTPTASPSTTPTTHPSTAPTTHPSSTPTTHPSTTPTSHPTTTPTTYPSVSPTGSPTISPSISTNAPTTSPTKAPTFSPGRVNDMTITQEGCECQASDEVSPIATSSPVGGNLTAKLTTGTRPNLPCPSYGPCTRSCAFITSCTVVKPGALYEVGDTLTFACGNKNAVCTVTSLL